MEKNKTLILVIIGIILIVLVGPKLGLFASLPDDLKLTREQFPLQYDFNLNTGINTIHLNEGINLDKVYDVSIFAKGCDDADGEISEKISINGKEISLGLPLCQSLFYADTGDESEYQHYQDRTIKIFSFLNMRDLNINVISGDRTKVLERKLKIFEMVDCTRSSQCPLILVGTERTQPMCDLSYHTCSLNAIPLTSTYTPPDKTTSLDPIQEIPSIFYIMGGIILFIILWGLFRR